MEKTPIGIIGCGDVLERYAENLNHLLPNTRVAAVSDLNLDRAREKASMFGLDRVCTSQDILDDPSIPLVLNLTPPLAHHEVSLEILRSGKHLYSEKPLDIDRAGATTLLDTAKERHLRIGSAPETFLNPAYQRAIRILEKGDIGRPLAATAFMMCRGPEGWHPNPVPFYQRGSGPLFDMGPYYLGALMAMFGSVTAVSAEAACGLPERHDRSFVIRPTVPTHVSANLLFENGLLATFIISFDVTEARLPQIEVYGSEGTMSLPDPNDLCGILRFKGRTDSAWTEEVHASRFARTSRGLGLSEMVAALAEDRPIRASGELGYHILDVMQTIYEAAAAGRRMPVASRIDRPEPLPSGFVF